MAGVIVMTAETNYSEFVTGLFYYQILLAIAHEIYVMLSVCGSCLTKLSELFHKKNENVPRQCNPMNFKG